MSETEQSEQPNVSIRDIMVLKQVVEVATARGALRANELSQVGVVYDRVSAWLDLVAPAQTESDNDQSDSEEHPQGETND